MRHPYFNGVVYALAVLSSTAVAQGQWIGYKQAPSQLTSAQAGRNYPNTYAAPTANNLNMEYQDPVGSGYIGDPVADGIVDGAGGECSSCESGNCGVSDYDGGWGTQSWFSGLLADGCGCGPGFFAGAGSVIMKRDLDDNNINLSYADTNPHPPVLTNRDTSMDYEGGFELFLGKCLCNGFAVEGRYWSLLENEQESSITGAAGDYATYLNLANLSYDPDGLGVLPATPVDGYFDAAVNHRLRREYEFQNLELNFIKTQCHGPLN